MRECTQRVIRDYCVSIKWDIDRMCILREKVENCIRRYVDKCQTAKRWFEELGSDIVRENREGYGVMRVK